MCTSSWATWPLSSALNGTGSTTRPSTTSKPCGSFIQPLTLMTKALPVAPVMMIGMPVRKCVLRGSRSQP